MWGILVSFLPLFISSLPPPLLCRFHPTQGHWSPGPRVLWSLDPELRHCHKEPESDQSHVQCCCWIVQSLCSPCGPRAGAEAASLSVPLCPSLSVLLAPVHS